MNRNKRGKIIVLVAPSGAGKSTMAARLMKDFTNLRFSVSATTRPPREGEEEGREYHFLTSGEFSQKVDTGEFLEWEEFYDGTRYGTLRSDVEHQLDKGYFILLDIDILGALNIKEIYKENALCIFIKPPSMDVLKDRLKKRGTETEESFKVRLERAEEELAYAGRFDEVVVNDQLETAYNEIRILVETYMKRTD